MRIHALWCHPRSVSTAFERIMRERGDLDVLHEPFMYHFYMSQTGKLFADFQPDPDHPTTYAGIREMILARSVKKPVFLKDMAFYVDEHLPDDPGFMRQMTHGFLVRDPAESIVSYHKRDPGFSCRELGHAAQLRLYRALVDGGLSAVVVTADQLRTAPEATLRRYWSRVGLPFQAHAFSWNADVPQDWETVAKWHKETLTSGRIQQAENTIDHQSALQQLGEPFFGYDAHHRPAYEVLRAIAEKQARQK